MSRGQRTEDGGQRTGATGNGPTAAELGRALVAGVDRLHAERGALVMQARDLRLKGEHAAREAVWERVTEITLQIEQSETDIAAFGGRGAMAGSRGGAEVAEKAWRTDLPDDEIDVIVRTNSEDYELVLAFHSDGLWMSSIRHIDLGDSVTGWMHITEAVAILDAAARDDESRPLLRDPTEELPDYDTTVVAVIEPTDDESYVENLYFSDAGWRYAETRSPLMSGERTFGWMHVHEAVEVLRKAVRHG